MNKRQRSKWIPSLWLVGVCREQGLQRFTLYAVDFKRGARLSWGEWSDAEELLRFRVPLKTRSGGRRIRHIPFAKLAARRVVWIDAGPETYKRLEQMLYGPFRQRDWLEMRKIGTSPYLRPVDLPGLCLY
ncbi:hypothetical protein QWJ34_20775 [Saccharibacillus sp. CPCC 101409]|uniref:hypothetical protein n=1 Tax=Saccharibacillus sp. CPCC 101409 TaxID=3058041 RepID=UPI002673BD83|nr:hypothetical protein [Saccharibacillus sp. CPCC 101409]MDO3412210.1 hypothetical protein [Saccharibacillus sp. CPCC 101409]